MHEIDGVAWFQGGAINLRQPDDDVFLWDTEELQCEGFYLVPVLFGQLCPVPAIDEAQHVFYIRRDEARLSDFNTVLMLLGVHSKCWMKQNVTSNSKMWQF